MNQADFDQIVNFWKTKIDTTLKTKSEQYASSRDRLANFKAAANLQQCSPQEACLSFVSKHIVALYQMVYNKSADNFDMYDFHEKIGDTICYMILLDGVIADMRDKD